MDLERLPSGKFDTNYLVCALAAVAMNILRLLGQHTLCEPAAPPGQAATHQDGAAGDDVQGRTHDQARGSLGVGLGANDRGFAVFERHYAHLAPRRRPSCA